MNNVVAWIAENGWDPCQCCGLQGYHHFNDTAWQECEPCAGFGFIIPGMPKGSWHFGDKED